MEESFQKQVRFAELPGLYQSLGRALISAGLSPAKSYEVLQNNISAHCCGCRIGISGAEIAQTAWAGSPGQNDNPKIARLIAGYCTRKGCDSHGCDLFFNDFPGGDWPAIWKSATELADAPKPNEAAERTTTSFAWTSVRWVLQTYGFWRLVATAAILSALLLLAIWRLRPPAYSRAPSGYEAAPGF